MISEAYSTENIKKQKKLIKAILLTLPIAAIPLFLALLSGINAIDIKFYSWFVSWIFFSTLFFLMQYSGKTYKYRKIFFVSIAFCILIEFILNCVEIGGILRVDMQDTLTLNHRYCHLAFPMLIIPAALTKTVIFPGHLLEGFASLAMMLGLWIAASLATGRGFCSWICFWGGLDEGFASLNRTPKFKINITLTYLPHAVLITTILLSFLTFYPVFCAYLCPWRAIERIPEISSIRTMIQVIVIVSLFIVLVVILPVLTGKRVQCSIFCPFVVFQGLTNKLNIFDIRIDTEKCKGCKKCIKECSTLSIDTDSITKGKTLLTCTKCGRCVDVCKENAISFHIKGTKIGVKTEIARNAFLYSAYFFSILIGSGIVSKTVSHILTLITTGKIA